MFTSDLIELRSKVALCMFVHISLLHIDSYCLTTNVKKKYKEIVFLYSLCC